MPAGSVIVFPKHERPPAARKPTDAEKKEMDAMQEAALRNALAETEHAKVARDAANAALSRKKGGRKSRRRHTRRRLTRATRALTARKH